MAIVDVIHDPVSAKVPSPAKPTWLRSNWGILVAVVALLAVMFLPTPEGLSIAGQRMLAILAFAVIVSMTEALDTRLRRLGRRDSRIDGVSSRSLAQPGKS